MSQVPTVMFANGTCAEKPRSQPDAEITVIRGGFESTAQKHKENRNEIAYTSRSSKSLERQQTVLRGVGSPDSGRVRGL